jgi:hypothetical protein
VVHGHSRRRSRSSAAGRPLDQLRDPGPLTGTIPGVTGPADLSDVGAIQLIIGPGPTSGVDLQLDLLTTAPDAPAELTAFSIE